MNKETINQKLNVIISNEILSGNEKHEQITSLFEKAHMENVKIKFIHLEWDNYQGGSGKVFEMEKIIQLPKDTKITDLKSECISWLNVNGFCDSWMSKGYYGVGLISVYFL